MVAGRGLPSRLAPLQRTAQRALQVRREGIVDDLILDVTGPPLAWDIPWRRQVRRIRQATRKTGTKIVVHYQINASSVTREPFERVMSALFRDRNVDGRALRGSLSVANQQPRPWLP